MKKLLALILASLMLLSLVACNSEPTKDDDTVVDTASPEASDPTTEEAPSEETDANAEETVETPEAKPEAKPEVKPEAKPETKPTAKPAEPEAPKEETKVEEKPAPAPANATLGETMLSVFRANRDKSLDDIANACISHESILFFGMTMPVEEPFFAEFGGDVTGFTKCVRFGPAIGSIPFSGMVFEVSGDAEAFAKDLKNRANPRWNICVEAEETVCEVYGNKVFFLMCPKALEE